MFYPKWLDINVTMMSMIDTCRPTCFVESKPFKSKGSSLWLSSVCLYDFDHKLKEYIALCRFEI